MKILRTALLALVLCFSSSANAGTCRQLDASSVALEPTNAQVVDAVDLSAFKLYCHYESFHPICKGIDGVKPSLALVERIDNQLRNEFEYRSDKVNYGADDIWSSKTLCGDCEDYVLYLSRLLASAGVGGRHMALMTWMPSLYLAHATLLVETSDAGWIEVGVGVLERPEPLRWDKGRRYAWMLMDGKQKWRFNEMIGS